MLKKTIILSMLLQGAVQAGVLIPEQIKAPVGYKPVLTVHAKGEQIYQCTVKQGEYVWETQAPDARLFDDQGKLVGNHSAGPVWEYKEGSRVVGRVLKKVEIQPESSISWLLVEVVSHQGDGLFSNVDFINRINTHGGLAPVSGCNANHLGGEKRVAYTADYIFYAN
ncbi:MAG: hypothetical protein RI893_1508 [Pseudomonadota bacterium]|jgi:hypothetical protein